MPTEELHEALRSAFRTKRTISGVKDDGGAYYPLSLLSRAPSYFSKGTFFMVTVAGRASKAAAKKVADPSAVLPFTGESLPSPAFVPGGMVSVTRMRTLADVT